VPADGTNHGSFSVRSADLDQVVTGAQRLLPLASIDRLAPTDDTVVRLAWTTVGAVTIADTANTAGLRLRVNELERFYYIALPVTGHVESHHAGTVINATHRYARVLLPVGDAVQIRSSHCRVLGMMVDCDELEAHLAALLGRPVKAPLKLAPALDVTTTAGAGWARLMRGLADEIRPDGLLQHPLMAPHLTGAALAGLLLAADHPYRDLLADPPPLRRPRPVRRTVDAIQATPEQPFTPADLAAVSGVSVRTLQNAFRQHVGVSPMQYLRQVRLERVHRDLAHSDPLQVTVADVAFRWGFTHLGRFAAFYRARYGVPPSQTLRDAT
jgi:AraC-like DNA-binding protein